jgi:multiple sugar transport system permease protein
MGATGGLTREDPQRPARHGPRVNRWWRSRLGRRQAGAAYLFLLPWLLGVLAFTAYPIIASAYYSLTDYPILNKPKWVGFKNYTDLIHDSLFWTSLRITTIFTVIVVPLGVIIGYLVALLLNQRVRGLSVWRTIYFLPSIVPAIATSYLWAWIFNPDFGILNGILNDMGLSGPKWFGSETWVLPAFIIMQLWGAGSGLILYLAALQQVPTALYDASRIDGANAWHRLYHVTLPMTSPILLFTTLTGMIGTFQIFTAGYVITSGGPANQSLFYVLYLYRQGWQYFSMGYASALGWVLLLIMTAFTVLILWLSRRLVHYSYTG